MIIIQSREWKYSGELNEQREACGFGKAADKKWGESYSGTFFNNTFEGIGKNEH